MSIVASDESPTLPAMVQANSAINKLNTVGKLVGNKILDFSRKMKRQMPLSASPNDGQNDLKSTSPIKYSVSNSSLTISSNEPVDVVDTASDDTSKNLINFDLPTTTTYQEEAINTSISQSDSANESVKEEIAFKNDTNINEFEPIQTSTSETTNEITDDIDDENDDDQSFSQQSTDLSSIYIPHLTTQQFTTKQHKLNYIRNYTKNSNTFFLFI